MSIFIDLNADLGEMETPEGRAAEQEILRHITSANIACGGHAGSPQIMGEMCRAAKAAGVVIGAHPAYPDRENFGRKSLKLGVDIGADTLFQSITKQMETLINIAKSEGASVRYVKPHGTLYTDAARDRILADLIAKAVAQIDSGFALMGFPNCQLEFAAKAAGLRFIGEGFMDRRYGADGHLIARGINGAVIDGTAPRIAQLLSLALDQRAIGAHGEVIKINAQSICLHGDSLGAVETARLARAALIDAGITPRSFTA